MLQIVTTSDGSKTIYHPEIGEHYHSKHGALQESRHVFLNSGLIFLLEKQNLQEVKILEVGFGTGLNFLLTAEYGILHNLNLKYTGIEAFPLDVSMIQETGYKDYVSEELWNLFVDNYSASLGATSQITQGIKLAIEVNKLLETNLKSEYDLLYFDAFAAIHQPEMWSEESLRHACQFLKPGGVFVTYAITGNLKRSMKSLGFKIEKAPGAPGKREMLRAIKI